MLIVINYTVLIKVYMVYTLGYFLESNKRYVYNSSLNINIILIYQTVINMGKFEVKICICLQYYSVHFVSFM